jgi:integrase
MIHSQHLVSASPSVQISAEGPIVDINWPYLMKTRAEVIQANDSMPAYLLMPEVTRLIDSELNANRRMAFEIMWMLGCRVSELLLLTPRHFVFNGESSYVNMPTLKRRAADNKRRRKRLNDSDSLGNLPLRQIPITDVQFIARLQSYIATERLPDNRRFFAITRRTVNRWLDESVAQYEAHYGPLQVHVSPHTFRHSFGVNAVLHFTPLKILQGWLGHTSQANTEIYTKVLFSDSFEFAKRIAWRPVINTQNTAQLSTSENR